MHLAHDQAETSGKEDGELDEDDENDDIEPMEIDEEIQLEIDEKPEDLVKDEQISEPTDKMREEFLKVEKTDENGMKMVNGKAMNKNERLRKKSNLFQTKIFGISVNTATRKCTKVASTVAAQIISKLSRDPLGKWKFRLLKTK